MSSDPRRLLRDDDLFAIALPRAPQVSPDGQDVLFLLERADAERDMLDRRLHVVSLKDQSVRAFDHLGPVTHARWETSRTMIATTLDGDGARIVKVNVEGWAMTVTSLPAIPSQLEIAPDGSIAALMMHVPWNDQSTASMTPGVGRLIERTVWRMDGVGELTGSDQLFRLDLATGRLVQLTDDLEWIGYFASGLSWSRDGREVLLAVNPEPAWEAHPFRSCIVAIDIETRVRREIVGGPDPYVSPCAGPLGDRLAFRHAVDDGSFHLVPSLWSARMDGSDRRLLADVGQDIGTFAYDWSGTGLYFSFVKGGLQQLWHTCANGERLIAAGLATDGGFEVDPYLAGGAEFSPCPGGVVAVLAGPEDPGRLVRIDDDGSQVDLLCPNLAALDHLLLGKCESIETSAPDGSVVQSWLIYPPGHSIGSDYPLILDIHGGPDAAFGGHFAFRAQRYAAEGYLVLMPNYTGSSGTNQSVFRSNYLFPDREHEQLHAAVDAVAGRTSIDTNRLYVTGLSAGATLTAWVIGKSHRFAAAVVRGPVVNWISHSLNHDLYSMYAGRTFSVAAWVDPMSYWARSPLSLSGEIRTPTLVIHGEADCRTPAAEGMQLYHALRLQNVPSALLLLPDAPHVSTRPSQWAEEQRQTLAWFSRFEGAPA